ncbi:SLBB domain-containing protein [Aerosakkonema funiforme]|uniref:SLBB domain-containing protein n=1 Tax=Aerosakkonema funiforme FACHB-1375 TaxID=2949571 RepID=A0A926ZF12_9CYAN|nr:SLBB domain-containing protein [Aerosakkonema funiforme]MBD2179602.1 SLBB domain-containing protein [Aerosakkonema funiforme FACHB-1375]
MSGAGCQHTSKIRQSVVGLMLLALFPLAYPLPSLAQVRRGNAPASPGTGISAERAYTLGAGDRIQIDVFNVPEYTREYQVLVNGTVNLALIGSVSVQGLTLEQAGAVISNRYARFLRRPIVTVSLVAPRPLNVAVSGEVNRPGAYVIPLTAAGGGVQQPTLTQALTLAGGITQSANLRGAQVRRVTRGGTQTINVDLFALLRAGDLRQDITLRDGDTIFIPTATSTNLAEAPIKADASFAPAQNQPLNVVVVGEVTRPGPQVVQPDQSGARPSVSRAIQVAGGVTQTANLRQVQVRRTTRGGAVQTIPVNLERLLRVGDRTQDLPLQQGDTVVVPTAASVNLQQASLIANTSIAPTQAQTLNVVVAGEVTRPGPQIVPPDQSGTQPTISRAIQVAGGVSPSADLSRVEVRRVTRGGAIQRYAVNLEQLLRAGDRTQDLILEQGDTIYIPPTANINLGQTSQIARTNFAPTQAQPINIVVAGEVTRPGPYTVQATQTGALPTLSRAIQVAGGTTQSADISRVQIRRITQSGTEQFASVDLNQLLQGGDRRQDLYLQEGDTIFIPTSTEINPAQSLDIASSSIAADPSQPLNVAVVGEVQRPGTYTLQTVRPAAGAPGSLPSFAGLPTVSQAIQLAGGITQTADIRRIEVRRNTRAGYQQILAVNFWQLLQGGDRTQDVVLQQGDTIFIPAATDINPAEVAQTAISSIAPATIRVNVVGEVARPGVLQVPPNTPLNQAILSAGGFNVRARRSYVDLLRLNPNGTVSRRGIRLDFAKGISEETNPILRDNDVVVVRRSSLASISDTLGTVLSPVGNFFSLFNFFRIFGSF